MAQSKDYFKAKNVLDANYQKHLNLLNIFAISLITSVFTIVWGYFTEKISFLVMYSCMSFVVIVFGILLYFSYTKLRKIMKTIENL